MLALLCCGQAMAYDPIPDCTGNEAWLPVGSGLSGSATSALVYNGALYVLHQTPTTAPPADTLYRISRWNGVSWETVTEVVLNEPEQGRFTGSRLVNAFAVYNGEFYIGGTFKSVDGIAGTKAIAKWNGGSWTEAATGLREVDAMIEYNGELYISGADASYTGKIIRGDGTSWSTPGGDGLVAGRIPTMAVNDGKLYVAGSFDVISGKNLLFMGVWDGTTWSAMPKRPGDYISNLRRIAFHDGKLFVFADNIIRANDIYQFAYWDGTDWQGLSGFMGEKGFRRNVGFQSFGDDLYIYATDDSVWTTTGPGVSVARWNGDTWTKVSGFDMEVRFMAEYDGHLYAGGAFDYSCGPALNHVAILCTDSDCGRVSGMVYRDEDADCTRDAAEKGLSRRIVEILPGPFYATTDENGNYSQYLPKGNYTVNMAPHLHWQQNCPASGGYDVTITAPGEEQNGNDFSSMPIPGIQDLRITGASSPARQGRQLTYAVTYENVGTITMSGTVRFTHDPILTFDSAQAAPARYSQGVAEWDFSGLEMGESRTIRIWTTVPITTPMETMICSRADIDPTEGDAATDNDDLICIPVTGSYDPNDIQVIPFGIEQNGVITPRDSVLTYWVRFQNTGNDTAFKVVVVDTLSAHLDISSIRLGAASHPFSFSIDKSNVLVWTFNDILLPDSNASEPNSHGFFKFSVKLKRDLPALTEIPNQAHIYFDYNAPVATNTVVSILGSSMSVERDAAGNGLAIYPNPAREQLRLNGDLRPGARVIVRDLLGRTVASYRYDGNGPMTVDASALAPGWYLLEAETASGISVGRFSVVK